MKQHGILCNIDSLSRLRRYAKVYPGSEISLRFNADVVAGENEKVQTGGDLSKFGILLTDLPIVKDIVSRYHLKVVGLHEQTGSGIAEVEKVYQAMQSLLAIATRDNFPQLNFIDFGGGFKVPYKPNEAAINYEEFGKKATRLFADYCKEYGKELFLYFEPGKYIAAEAGYFIVQVNTIKHTDRRSFVGTDAGFSQLIRPVLYEAYHHILNISNQGGALKKYTICGNICENGDFFAEERLLPEIREGDYLAILNAGAYCFSMASVYNLRALPAEVVIRDNEIKLSRAKMSFSELAAQVLKEYQ